MREIQIIDLTPENISDYGVCGYKDVKKHLELRKKIQWFRTYFPKGLRIKILLLEPGGYQGMIEYIPGEYAHRPVEARGYMFIHCLWVGFQKEFKGKGYASSLIDACVEDSRDQNTLGIAVVTRKGPFMAHNEIFLKKGFRIVDHAPPDFDLLAKKFDAGSGDPGFKSNMAGNLKEYGRGVTVIRSAQCPYTEKNVNAIMKSARNKFNLETRLVDLEDARAAQSTPCAFGTFCIVYDGEIISHHPISKTRFENIMKKRIKLSD